MYIQRCRLCLRFDQHNIEILSVGELNYQMHKLFGFQVEHTDSIKCICVGCEQNVQNFYKFYMLVKKTQENLTNSVNEGNGSTSSLICNLKQNGCNVKESSMKREISDDKILNDDSDQQEEIKCEFENNEIVKDLNNLEHETKNTSKIKKNKKLVSVDSSQDENDFPKELIKNGKLIIKGSRLTNLINKFYNIHCELCTNEKCFKKLNEMMKHYKDTHGQIGYVTCCSTKIYQHRAMYLHMAKHLQPSAFECPVCKTTVSRPHILKLHMQTHLPENEKLYKCDLCERRFGYSEGLRQHKLSRHIPVEKRQIFNCDKCKKSFSLFSSFNSHVKSAHSGTEILCSECGKCFKRNTEYKIHALVHDPKGENQKQCQQCGFVCKNRVTLKIHMKRHEPGPLLECNECKYKTHRKYSLQRHIHVTHSVIKSFQCIVCQIYFKTKTHLSTHMRRHTDPKISCLSCAKIFTSNGGFLKHRRKVHSDII